MAPVATVESVMAKLFFDCLRLNSLQGADAAEAYGNWVIAETYRTLGFGAALAVCDALAHAMAVIEMTEGN